VEGLARLWKALEELPAAEAVKAEWQERVGPALHAIESLLRPRPSRASSFPRLDPSGYGLPYSVVEHDPGEFAGVCRETGNSITLRKQDLVVYELDRRLFVERLADALGIIKGGTPSDWNDGYVRVGHFASSNARYNVLLTLPLEPADLHNVTSTLVTNKLTPFILMAPTRRQLQEIVDRIIHDNGSFFISLGEIIATCRQGHFQSSGNLNDRIHGVRIGDSSERNVFSLKNGLWTLRFAGATIILPDCVGMKCIARVIAHGKRGIDVIRLRALVNMNAPIMPSAGLEISDTPAIEQYRDEFEDLIIQLDQARNNKDKAMAETIQLKLNDIKDQIASAEGLNGRTRRTNDGIARARVSLTNATARAIAKIKCKHLGLACHLRNSIRTGEHFFYVPKFDVAWEF
jgi:hypothetical protein